MNLRITISSFQSIWLMALKNWFGARGDGHGFRIAPARIGSGLEPSQVGASVDGSLKFAIETMRERIGSRILRDHWLFIQQISIDHVVGSCLILLHREGSHRLLMIDHLLRRPIQNLFIISFDYGVYMDPSPGSWSQDLEARILKSGSWRQAWILGKILGRCSSRMMAAEWDLCLIWRILGRNEDRCDPEMEIPEDILRIWLLLYFPSFFDRTLMGILLMLNRNPVNSAGMFPESYRISSASSNHVSLLLMLWCYFVHILTQVSVSFSLLPPPPHPPPLPPSPPSMSCDRCNCRNSSDPIGIRPVRYSTNVAAAHPRSFR